MLRLSKVATVMRREYTSRVYTKGFWISALVVPVTMLAFVVLPAAVVKRQGGTFTPALLADDAYLAGEIQAELERRDAGAPGVAALDVRLAWVKPAHDANHQREELKQRVLRKELAGVLVVPPDVFIGGKVEYLSTNLTAFRLIGRLDSAVERAVLRRRLRTAGIEGERLEEVTKRLKLVLVRLTSAGGEARDAAGGSFLLSYLLTFLNLYHHDHVRVLRHARCFGRKIVAHRRGDRGEPLAQRIDGRQGLRCGRGGIDTVPHLGGAGHELSRPRLARAGFDGKRRRCAIAETPVVFRALPHSSGTSFWPPCTPPPGRRSTPRKKRRRCRR